MKTSNILLIVLASAIFLIPASIMLYQRQYYVPMDRSIWSNNPPKFGHEVPGYAYQKVSPFRSVNIAGKSATFRVILAKDSVSGIRLSDDLTSKLSAKVVNDVLELTLNETSDRRYVEVVIFGPDVQQITASDVNDFRVLGESAALRLSLQRVAWVSITEESKFAHLRLEADSVKELNIEQAPVKNLTANIKATHFSSKDVAYDTVRMNAVQGRIDFGVSKKEATPATADKWKIGDMHIVTEGAGSVSVAVPVGQISGQLSDATSVNMPVSYLRKLIQ